MPQTPRRLRRGPACAQQHQGDPTSQPRAMATDAGECATDVHIRVRLRLERFERHHLRLLFGRCTGPWSGDGQTVYRRLLVVFDLVRWEPIVAFIVACGKAGGDSRQGAGGVGSDSIHEVSQVALVCIDKIGPHGSTQTRQSNRRMACSSTTTSRPFHNAHRHRTTVRAVGIVGTHNKDECSHTRRTANASATASNACVREFVCTDAELRVGLVSTHCSTSV